MKTILTSIFLCFLFTSLSSQCFTDRHNTSSGEAWITCTKQPNPNNSRENSHWILYDFGTNQNLGTTHIWNINAAGNTSMGIQEAVIDYSVDGFTWIEWGTFQLSEAPSSGFYEGEVGPDLTGLGARMILITVVENYGNSCSGLSEIKIQSLGEVSDNNNLVLNESTIAIQPNPAFNYTVLSVDFNQTQSLKLVMTNVVGQTVFEKIQEVNAGKQDIRIDLNYPNGQYIINLDNGEESHSVKLSIVNP